MAGSLTTCTYKQMCTEKQNPPDNMSVYVLPKVSGILCSSSDNERVIMDHLLSWKLEEGVFCNACFSIKSHPIDLNLWSQHLTRDTVIVPVSS